MFPVKHKLVKLNQGAKYIFCKFAHFTKCLIILESRDGIIKIA